MKRSNGPESAFLSGLAHDVDLSFGIVWQRSCHFPMAHGTGRIQVRQGATCLAAGPLVSFLYQADADPRVHRGKNTGSHQQFTDSLAPSPSDVLLGSSSDPQKSGGSLRTAVDPIDLNSLQPCSVAWLPAFPEPLKCQHISCERLTAAPNSACRTQVARSLRPPHLYLLQQGNPCFESLCTTSTPTAGATTLAREHTAIFYGVLKRSLDQQACEYQR